MIFKEVDAFKPLLIVLINKVDRLKSKIYYVIITLFYSLLNNAISKSQGILLAANMNTLYLFFTIPSN